MSQLRSCFAVDLGASSLRLRRGAETPVISMPARAVLDDQGVLFAIGEEARIMDGRVWGALDICRPTGAGTVADHRVTLLMLRNLMRQSGRGRLVHGGRVGVCVPEAATDMGTAALHQVCRDAGFSDVRLVPQALAAAVGAGIAVDTPYATVVVDLGAEHTSAALVVYGRLIVSRSTRFGGTALDVLVAKHLREKYETIVSGSAAEAAKISLSTAAVGKHDRTMIRMRGQSSATGRPRGVALPVAELQELLLPRMTDAVCDQISGVLDGCPVEMSADVFERGVVLTGGGALLQGLVESVRAQADLPVHVVDDCEHVAVMGAQALMAGDWPGLERSAFRAATLSGLDMEADPLPSGS